MRTVLLVIATAAALALAQETAEPGPISADTARHRIAAAIERADPDAETVASLAEVAERAVDPALAASAAYNAGTLAVRLGDSRAVDLLRRADALSPDAGTRIDARFNLGHALMPRSDAGEPDSVEAIDSRIADLRKAADAFRSVLDLDPTHADAARNTELVRRLIRDLQQQRDEMERRQQAQEGLAEQLRELAEQQRQQAEQSQQRAEQGQGSDEAAGSRQRSVSEQTERAQQAAEESGAGEEARQELDRARDAQERAEEALDRGDAAGAAEAQQEAAEALQRAAEQTRPGDGERGADQPQPGEGEQTQDREGEPAGEAEDPGAGEPTIDPVARALLDKERQEREQRARYLQRGRQQQVERDW